MGATKSYCFAAIAALFLASSADASEWWYVTSTTDKEAYFVDVQSLKSDNGKVVFWDYMIYDKISENVAGSKARLSLDCASRKLTFLAIINYSPAGVVLGSSGTQPAFDIAPDTIADGIRKFVCEASVKRTEYGSKVDTTPEDFAVRVQAVATAPK